MNQATLISPPRSIRVLNLISEKPRLSQRDIASQSGLSLGLVNLTLKRLLQTGHIKVSNLNKKKVEYLVTPKGFFEKANHSYAYLSKTLKVFMEYQHRLTTILQGLVDQGTSAFAVLGAGEIAELVDIALRGLPTVVSFRRIREGESVGENEVLLDCRLKINGENATGISILATLLDGTQNYD
jgi:DNA-binding MarR family transcriptional regulator